MTRTCEEWVEALVAETIAGRRTETITDNLPDEIADEVLARARSDLRTLGRLSFLLEGGSITEWQIEIEVREMVKTYRVTINALHRLKELDRKRRY